MVNQALRMKIAYWSEKEKEEEENTRDRSVPDGSDNDIPLCITFIITNHRNLSTFPYITTK